MSIGLVMVYWYRLVLAVTVLRHHICNSGTFFHKIKLLHRNQMFHRHITDLFETISAVLPYFFLLVVVVVIAIVFFLPFFFFQVRGLFDDGSHVIGGKGQTHYLIFTSLFRCRLLYLVESVLLFCRIQ